MKIVFILPVSGGGGGAHSVIQEVNEMVRMGQDVHVAINKSNYVSMLVTYSDMPLVLGRFFQYETEEELAGFNRRGYNFHFSEIVEKCNEI